MGERADRFALYREEDLERETRTVRLDMSFKDIIDVRRQAEMIIEAMQEVIAKTHDHHEGEKKQRMHARQIADYTRRQLARFNGKTPHGDTYKAKDSGPKAEER